MALWSLCPGCGKPMEVEWVHNGVMMVPHGTHCGWGHGYMHPDDCFTTFQAAERAARGEQERTQFDWEKCSVVEIVPGRVSGAPVVRGTRLTVDAILTNFDAGLSPEEVAAIFVVPVETVRAILAFRVQQRGNPGQPPR